MLRDPPTEDNPEWRDPLEDPPPRATKLIIYTVTGLVILGPWADDGVCALWMPCPRVGRERRDMLRERHKAQGSPYAVP